MAARSGQITVTTSGTAVQGPDVDGEWFTLVPLNGNTGQVYVGNDGSDDVTTSNGCEIPSAGLDVQVWNLEGLWFDADTNGDKISWIRKA